MRKAPEKAPSAVSGPPKVGAAKKVVLDERTYCFLTPVFGGGVRVDGQHKLSDPRTPVRVPSLRGQLRFWWRACNPRGLRSSGDLLAAEARVFGSTEGPSPLVLWIVKQPEPARDVAVLRDRFAAVEDRQARAYGAFPLRDPNEGIDHGVLHDHPGEWTVALSYPEELEEDIEAAFWAWAHFGGLGGRTRRGFGAVEEVRRGHGKKLAGIEEGWKRHVSGVDAPWPHLPSWDERRLRRKKGCKDGPAAQEYLLGILRRLRQGDIGRNKQADDVPGKHPGRSYWPEPDAIRKATGVSSPDHSRPVTQVEAFPRAAFGLPILFHFKDRRDPPDTRLLPRVKDKDDTLERKGRLASPLLLRPHRADDRSVEALAVVLVHPPPDDLVLVLGAEARKKHPQAHKLKKDELPVRSRPLTRDEALDIGLGGRPSPLVSSRGEVPVVSSRGEVLADPIERFLEEIR
jgi:CRISPR-associated protein Cmr1